MSPLSAVLSGEPSSNRRHHVNECRCGAKAFTVDLFQLNSLALLHPLYLHTVSKQPPYKGKWGSCHVSAKAIAHIKRVFQNVQNQLHMFLSVVQFSQFTVRWAQVKLLHKLKQALPDKNTDSHAIGNVKIKDTEYFFWNDSKQIITGSVLLWGILMRGKRSLANSLLTKACWHIFPN